MDKETKKEIDSLKKRIEKLEQERIIIIERPYYNPVLPSYPSFPAPYNPYNPPITFC